VKEVALSRNIPVEQPATLRSEEMLAILRGYAPDCIVVAAYGMILPESVLELPKYGCINVHASLLPKYRGAAPINRCIMNGESESGVTIMQMDVGLDTGDMLSAEAVPIGADMTASELHDTLAEVGGRLLVETLADIDSVKAAKQDDALSTYAEKLTKAECEIDFTRTPTEICHHVRGLADYPCAWTVYWQGVELCSTRAGLKDSCKLSQDTRSSEQGRRIKVYRAVAGEAEGVRIGGVTLTEVQPEGGKRMSGADFLRGLQ
jgi:methionyl-tRNA formyltransferase